MVAQGLPVSGGLIESLSRPAGQPKASTLPLGEASQSTAWVFPDKVAVLVPESGVFSNELENFSMARTPQALATVVSQRPRCCRPKAPRTSLGISSFHAG